MADTDTAQSDLPTGRLVITGAAGLVGQNLVILLREAGYRDIIAIDCHADNLATLANLHPSIRTCVADLSRPGDWQSLFAGANAVVQLQAQISATDTRAFTDNTLRSTDAVLQACHEHRVPYLVHVSSSVVRSAADDNYVRSKRAQEARVRDSGIPHCILRPTLMFGWFDRKHLGWLSRFMRRSPVFPVPGNGRYLRQPLYVRDFCRVLHWCLAHRPHNAVYDITGTERIDYIDLIRAVKRHSGGRTLILPLPFRLFRALLACYACFSDNPPFTPEQLDALVAGDVFDGEDWPETFGITPTPLQDALREAFTAQPYADKVLKRT